MKEKIKKYRDINRTRTEIIKDNFFSYLDGKQQSNQRILGSKYEIENDLSKTTVSNWRHDKSKMTVDHIFQAAKYFNITVNDLYYSEQEKLKISAHFHELNFDPINAQQILNVKLMEESFKKPLLILIPSTIIYILIGYLTYYLLNYSSLFILMILIALILSFIMFRNNYGIDKTYVISYLDDIYYKRKNLKNRFFSIQIILRLISLVTLVFCMLFIIYGKVIENINLRDMAIIMIMEYIISIIQISMSITNIKFKYKEEIYDDDISSYKSRFINFTISMFLLTSSVILYINNLIKFWVVLSFCIFNVIISGIDFLIESKNYSEYRLMYEENNKSPRELFQKK